jgi:hypothetical protein
MKMFILREWFIQKIVSFAIFLKKLIHADTFYNMKVAAERFVFLVLYGQKPKCYISKI